MLLDAEVACQTRKKEAVLDPRLETVVRGRASAKPVAESAFHWQSVLSTKKIASAHTKSDTRGRPPPKGCPFWWAGRSDSMSAQSSLVISLFGSGYGLSEKL